MAREMKDSGIEWIGEIPINWAVTNIGRLFEVRAGGDAKLDLYSDEKDEEHPYPVYTNTTVSNQVYAYTSVPVFEENTITVTGRGEVGRAFFRKEKYDAIIRLLVLKPKLSLDCRYYTYWIDSVIVFFSNSAAVEQLSAQQILPYKVCFLSYREQEKIADFLDEKCADIDNVLEKTRASIEEYKKLKQAVITQAVTKGVRGNREMKDSGIAWIGEIPVCWGITSLKYLCKMQAGKTLSSEQIEKSGKYPVYGANGIRGFYKEFNTDGTYLLIGRQGALCGNVHKAEGKFWATEHAVLVNVFGNCNLNFLYYMLIGMNLNKYALNTAAQPGLAMSTILNTKMCIAPFDEQERIAAFLDEKCLVIDDLIAKKEQYLSEIENYKKSLIYEYVTGKKEVPQNC